MFRTDGRLADGRTIRWYDREEGREAVPDRRDLPETTPMSQLRYDVLTDEYIVLAAHRQNRTFMPPANECPLCPSRPDYASEVPSEDYEVAVFDNRFPALSDAVTGVEEIDDPLFASAPAYGACEVVCFSSNHKASFKDLSLEQARLVVDTWADRTRELSARESVEYVYPFENRGAEIGVTLPHPHGQIYAYDMVPPRARKELDAARRHHSRTGCNLFGDILSRELAEGSRIVAQNATWVAFVPFAARWPVEVHLYPRRQTPDLAALDEAQRDGLAELYRDVLGRFDAMYDAPLPYISAWQQAPAKGDHPDRRLAWLHVELFSIRRSADKLKYLAGTESGQGAFSNDVAPEAVAERLRELGTSR
ncbi:galactose-1-phosphate uridylyltransferase [Dermacoccus sp. 147Ba]|uniref:galactose-1-phosphate uridylyltransferase n=1 Tax=unclassified Dermacoccus TaxID=2643059 RepID=UPI00101CB5DE|nr:MULTISPECIES: galactose-1-phosphate uridylyltransferase [unclassified Dermacoccus]QNK53069.1 galactose-1-phosphate uridylyltransferase [Dermacoccus sp. PAMC28757]RYI21193.1 galactose-1-phosphate uridylyltransferase [Dermacoccus sp. 147Ba]